MPAVNTSVQLLSCDIIQDMGKARAQVDGCAAFQDPGPFCSFSDLHWSSFPEAGD